ncbi:MAG: class I SAM-dependent methyltransferase [Verrucomicrobiae bacterium]|nr:class I SAM-dependent methyltransferase [Verrucomicrobiae bacterium]
MAIDIEAARLLLLAAREGVSFKRCLTLGRQHYYVGNRETRRALREAGYDPDKFPEIYQGEYGSRYAEPFFKILGAERVDSLDASPIENATIVHDLNLPIPDELKNCFDVVYDGGTLEHVFNFPMAIKNAMEAVKPGGRLFLHTTGNNYFGHGFYQFSPELFYRVLSDQNGYQVERFIAIEYGPRRRWFEVKDPQSIKTRTVAVGSFPTLLFIQAKRKQQSSVLVRCPLQSDYADISATVAHSAKSSAGFTLSPFLRRALLDSIPSFVRAVEAIWYSGLNRRYSFRNEGAFTPIVKSTLFAAARRRS